MKFIYNILLIACSLFVFACQDEELTQGEQTGYLRLSVSEDKSTSTRAVPTDYKPEQIAVQIVNASGKVVEETEDAELWEGQAIELPVGTYTVKAASNGFDGKDTGFDIPYYVGSKEITITADAELNETITCTLANVKVTVKYDADFVSKVASVATQVGDTLSKYTPLNFTSSEKRSAYFPAEGLFASITVKSKDGRTNTTRRTFKDVKARDHYILNVKLAEGGDDRITVTVDPTTHEYSYTFYVSTVPTNGAATTVGTWDKVAYLRAENITVGSGVSTESIKFQYREVSTVQTKASETENKNSWIDVETTVKDGVYTAFVTGLNPATEYEYHLVNNEAVEIQAPQTFMTEDASEEETTREVLQNAGFEDWYLLEAKLGFGNSDSKTWYPCSKDYYTENGASFWDSSNPGTTQGMGSLSGGLNPTQGTTEVVHTGNYAAKLETQWAILKLAAASIYTGKFNSLVGANGAKIDFGQPFSSRPISLKGWYQYKPEVIDDEKKEVGSSGVLKKGDTDQCSIYIILAKGTHQVNNTDTKTLLTAENVKADDNFIAYGELPADQSVSTNGKWKEFNIPLKYKEDQFGEKPTHLIIVCSSSKYGDYFTGAVGSTLYLDDFELVYDGTPTIWE